MAKDKLTIATVCILHEEDKWIWKRITEDNIITSLKDMEDILDTMNINASRGIRDSNPTK